MSYFLHEGPKSFMDARYTLVLNDLISSPGIKAFSISINK